MVEKQQDLKAIEQELTAKLMKAIEDRQTWKKSIDEANFKVFTSFENPQQMAVITEIPACLGVMPDDFKYFCMNWDKCVKLINPMLADLQYLKDEQGYGVTKTVANAPWPLYKRLTYTVRFPMPDYKPGEHVLLMSSKGAEAQAVFTE